MQITIISLGVFLSLVLVLSFLRIKSAGRFTVETREIVAAVVVVGLFLFVSGEIKEIAFGDVRLVREIKKAADKLVKENVADQQVDTLTKETVMYDETESQAKGPVTRIPKLIETKAEALSFQLRSQYYVAAAVAKYIEELTKAPFLKYLVFNDRQGEFIGMADAREIARQFHSKDGRLTPENLTNYIKEGRIEKLRDLPGYIGAEEALSSKLSTREALSKMLEKNFEKLPVIDDTKHFVGIAYRTQLMGKILMALAPADESMQ